MIEVFRTDVTNMDHARLLVDRIHYALQYCHANFDLQDCDKILRVAGIRGETDVFTIIHIMKDFGFNAQILPDDWPSLSEQAFHGEHDSAIFNT